MTTEFGSAEPQDRASVEATYTYQPLPSDSAVRLIQICPDHTEAHGFSLEIQSFTLKEAPPFCCLSYTWKSATVSSPKDHYNEDGDNEAAATIAVKSGDKVIAISENLFEFLCRARNEGWFTPDDIRGNSQQTLQLNDGATTAALPSYLWIDAISINQNDTRERSHQVSMMGDIYSLSDIVLVWLGKDNPSPRAERVFRTFIPEFLDVWRDEGLAPFKGKDPFCTHPDLVRRLGGEICAQWKGDWISFFMFLVRCRWFRRGWIVQEVVLKSLDNINRVVLLCGSLGILWIHLLDFLTIFTELEWRPTLRRRLQSYDEETKTWAFGFSHLLQSARSVLATRNLVKLYSLGKSTDRLRWEFSSNMTENERIYNIFFKIVTRLRPQQFADKRDTIYGFAGLLKAVLLPGTSSPIRADYSLSYVDVLTNEVWNMVSNMSYLDVLSGTQFNVLGDDHPSWVTQFWVPFVGTTVQTIHRSRDWEQFDASKSKSPCALFRLTEGRALTLIGAKVVDITLSGIELFLDRSGASLLGKLLEMLLGQNRTYLPTNEPKDEALCRTLVADTFPSLSDKAQYCTAFREWWTNVLAKRIVQSRLYDSSGDEDIIDLYRELGSDWDWLPSLEDVLKAADNFVVGGDMPSNAVQMVIHKWWIRRTFFRTRDGHFGLGPTSLDVMDEVWLLKGGRTPFVSRKRTNGNGYHLVGDVYVHGLMYGEAATPSLDEQMGPVTIF